MLITFCKILSYGYGYKNSQGTVRRRVHFIWLWLIFLIAICLVRCAVCLVSFWKCLNVQATSMTRGFLFRQSFWCWRSLYMSCPFYRRIYTYALLLVFFIYVLLFIIIYCNLCNSFFLPLPCFSVSMTRFWVHIRAWSICSNSSRYVPLSSSGLFTLHFFFSLSDFAKICFFFSFPFSSRHLSPFQCSHASFSYRNSMITRTTRPHRPGLWSSSDASPATTRACASSNSFLTCWEVDRE
jgi:hypothetical protein